MRKSRSWAFGIRHRNMPDRHAVFFSPLAMINAWADGVTPWEKGPEVESIFRQYAALRMELMPYLYSSFKRMHDTGLPVVRGLVMDFPTDRDTYNVDDEYMYGDSLLVAPILSGNRRSVYLPRGTKWVDWWTAKVYEGGQRLDYAASLTVLPLFVREGAMVPMQPSMDYSVQKTVETLTVHTYPGPKTKRMLYDDDGTTLDYQKGQSVTAELSSERQGDKDGTIVLSLGAPQGKYTPTWKTVAWQVFGLTKPPKHVLLAGRRLEASDYEYVERAQTLRINTPFGKAQKVRIEL